MKRKSLLYALSLLLLLFVLLIILGNAFMNRREMTDMNISIGKDIYLVVDGKTTYDSSYIGTILSHKNSDSMNLISEIELINENVLNSLKTYLHDNGLQIKRGTYKLNQTWTYDEVINTLVFEKK